MTAIRVAFACGLVSCLIAPAGAQQNLFNLNQDVSLARIDDGELRPVSHQGTATGNVLVSSVPSNYFGGEETKAPPRLTTDPRAANSAMMIGLAAVFGVGATILTLHVMMNRTRNRIAPPIFGIPRQ